VPIRLHTLILLLWGALFLAGCGEEEVTEPGAETAYVGTFVATSGNTGIVKLNVNGADVAGQAMFQMGGELKTATITGTLSGNTLTATASDGATITGTLSGDRLTGTINGGDATFSLSEASSTSEVEVYLGSYASTSGESDAGKLNICVIGSTMWGMIVKSGTVTRTDLVGTISGNTVKVRTESDGVEVATGTKNGNNWIGTYTGKSSSGTWSAGLFQ
jgi:hypothetical protein